MGGDKPKIGVGVSFSPFNAFVQQIEIPPLQLADFRIPIFIGSRFKLEPEFGILHISNQEETSTEASDFSPYFPTGTVKETFTQLRLAISAYYRHPVSERLEIYVGPRVGIIRNSESMSTNGGEDSETLTHLSLGAVLGGEYFFSTHFSLGGEVQFNYLNRDEPENSFLSRQESSLLNTHGSVLLRFYF